MNDEVYLYANDKIYEGWEEITITRSIEALSGSFSLSITEDINELKKIGDMNSINEGDKCEVKIGDETMITGWIDEVGIKLDSNTHTIEVKGRDKTCDLVDCSLKSGEFNKVKLEKAVEELAKIYGIKVITETNTGGVVTVKIQPGETPFESLDKLAKQKGLLITSDKIGNVLITTNGTKKTGITLKEGENVLSADVNISNKDRFKKYIVLGENGISGTAEDPEVKRFRQMVIIAESKADIAYCKNRASWEAAVRAARAKSLTVEVQGWRYNGNLWEGNTLVNVDISTCRVSNEERIISQVEFTKGAEKGTTTSLTLKRKDAYKIEPV